MNTQEFIRQFRQADVKTLAFQVGKYPEVDKEFALDQIAGYQTALQKLPSYARIPDIHYPHHLSMEQCSSEATAREKVRILLQTPSPKETLADLTAGYGVDFSFLAAHFREAVSVERQEYLCELAAHNYPLLGLPHAHPHCGDCIEFLQQMNPVDWIFLDPARRNRNGGKAVAISDCEPDVCSLESLLLKKAGHVMVKLSPMLDINLALHSLKHIRQVHVIAVNNECKELLFILGQECIPPKQVQIHATNLQKSGQAEGAPFSFTLQEEADTPVSYSTQIKTYLYEPHAALMKAGGFRSITSHWQVEKLHPNSHLYTSNSIFTDFPGRIFQVKKTFGFEKKELKELQALKQTNLTVRNFPQGVHELRKRLRLSEGGNHYLFATTLSDGEKVLILCQKPIIS